MGKKQERVDRFNAISAIDGENTVYDDAIMILQGNMKGKRKEMFSRKMAKELIVALSEVPGIELAIAKRNKV